MAGKTARKAALKKTFASIVKDIPAAEAELAAWLSKEIGDAADDPAAQFVARAGKSAAVSNFAIWRTCVLGINQWLATQGKDITITELMTIGNFARQGVTTLASLLREAKADADTTDDSLLGVADRLTADLEADTRDKDRRRDAMARDRLGVTQDGSPKGTKWGRTREDKAN